MIGTSQHADSAAGLEQAITLSKRLGQRAELLYLDLYGIDLIDGSFGHLMGDARLRRSGRHAVGRMRDEEA